MGTPSRAKRAEELVLLRAENARLRAALDASETALGASETALHASEMARDALQIARDASDAALVAARAEIARLIRGEILDDRPSLLDSPAELVLHIAGFLTRKERLRLASTRRELWELLAPAIFERVDFGFLRNQRLSFLEDAGNLKVGYVRYLDMSSVEPPSLPTDFKDTLPKYSNVVSFSCQIQKRFDTWLYLSIASQLPQLRHLEMFVCREEDVTEREAAVVPTGITSLSLSGFVTAEIARIFAGRCLWLETVELDVNQSGPELGAALAALPSAFLAKVSKIELDCWKDVEQLCYAEAFAPSEVDMSAAGIPSSEAWQALAAVPSIRRASVDYLNTDSLATGLPLQIENLALTYMVLSGLQTAELERILGLLRASSGKVQMHFNCATMGDLEEDELFAADAELAWWERLVANGRLPVNVTMETPYGYESVRTEAQRVL